MRKMLKSFSFSRGGQYTSVWWKQCDRENISAWIYHSSTWCRIRVSCMYMRVFVYLCLCMFISICVFVYWHEYITATSGAGSERISSIILSSLALNTQYMQIYANQRVTTAEANILHQKSFSPALTSRVCVRYDKSFLPEHFAQLHNLRYVATSEMYSQKYTHTHLRNAQK